MVSYLAVFLFYIPQTFHAFCFLPHPLYLPFHLSLHTFCPIPYVNVVFFLNTTHPLFHPYFYFYPIFYHVDSPIFFLLPSRHAWWSTDRLIFTFYHQLTMFFSCLLSWRLVTALYSLLFVWINIIKKLSLRTSPAVRKIGRTRKRLHRIVKQIYFLIPQEHRKKHKRPYRKFWSNL